VIFSAANGVNSQGQIAGTWMGSSIGWRGFVFQVGSATPIEPPQGGTFTEATAISENGTVAGYWGNHGTGIPWALHGFLWRDGEFTDLDIPFDNVVLAVNQQDQVTGYMYNLASGQISAFMFGRNGLTDLGLLPQGISSRGQAINGMGHIVGLATVAAKNELGYIRRAFLWDGKTLDNLGVTAGGSGSWAFGINDHDQVVGYCEGGTIVQDAFIWQNGVMRNLNDLIPRESGLWLRHAVAINNAGQIAVGAEDINHEYVTVLLSPIPPKTGDVDCNWTVDMDDLVGVITRWGENGAPGSIPADLDQSGTVNLNDLVIVLTNWSS
jgi:probable HAF family extracellular repeat protein